MKKEIVIFDPQKMLSSKLPSSKPSSFPPVFLKLDPMDDQFLHAVFFYHYLEAEQITKRFYSPTSRTLVKNRLKLLVEKGFLQLVQVQNKRTRKIKPVLPFVYTPDSSGVSRIESLGVYPARYFRPYKQRQKSELFLWHTLSVNDFLVAVDLLAVRDKRVTIVEIYHELVLKTEPCIVPMGESKKPREISPDGMIDLLVDRGEGLKKRRFTIWLELDQGTITSSSDFKRKVRLILTFYQSGAYWQRFKSKDFRVAFATTEQHGRVEMMRKWIREELAETFEKKWVSDLFLCTYFSPEVDPTELFFAPVWYTPFEDAQPVPLLPLT